MPQYRYETSLPDDDDVEVLMGYDRPLNYVFCVVMGAGEEPIYSNLCDDNAGIHQQDVEYYRQILDALNITVPESIFQKVKQDQQAK